ncbi:hypothetical protein LPA44_17180 [Halobacterium sp. KA-4]|uniref:hypothetical protein n=1 Tax=Halobacterium sp. KA-4 TaxID=2896367 RepID=UPI001E625973|nr:hypothetical protein [Halobacterium sp. KA-4]MCD2201598.1 hypothetical protein [Halobacterium sp. KA-4]
MPSRRALLTGISAGLATALAGCSASESHQSPPEDGTLVTDYITAKTRSSTEQPPIVAPRDDEEAAADETSTTAEPLSLHVIESEEDAAALEFADDATDVAAVRRLVAETAYASESVLVYQTRISECHRLKLNYVTKDSDGQPSVEFCQVVRDATVECERDARDHVAAFVRLPFPADEYSGYSVSGGGGCNPVPERYQNESESP